MARIRWSAAQQAAVARLGPGARGALGLQPLIEEAARLVAGTEVALAEARRAGHPEVAASLRRVGGQLRHAIDDLQLIAKEQPSSRDRGPGHAGAEVLRMAARGPVRVLLVEAHAAVREAIALAFENEPDFRIAGEAASLAEARQRLDQVDVAVIGLDLPDGYGGDLIADLREVNPQAQALVLSATVDRSQLARAVDRGAAGVLDRTTHLDDMVHCVRRLHAGETLLPATEVVELLRQATRERERELGDRQAIASLTPRERDVLALLAQGLTSQSVAERLHITVRTERNHTANILAKLGVHSQLQAVLFVLRHEIG